MSYGPLPPRVLTYSNVDQNRSWDLNPGTSDGQNRPACWDCSSTKKTQPGAAEAGTWEPRKPCRRVFEDSQGPPGLLEQKQHLRK